MTKRFILASLLAVLLLGSGLGTVPSEATTRDPDRVTVVYRGYTVSWSSNDPTTARVGRSPGRAQHIPRAASSSSVDRAKSQVSAQSTDSNSAGENDSCTAVPDSFGSANFTRACAIHDQCYGPESSTDRAQCDLQLLGYLRLACYQAYATRPAQLLTCYTVAAIYYIGVRLFGGYFYDGTGNPA